VSRKELENEPGEDVSEPGDNSLESIALVAHLMVSKAKGKVCLKITKQDSMGFIVEERLIHSKTCNCLWSDK
jgi:hypothetical protein